MPPFIIHTCSVIPFSLILTHIILPALPRCPPCRAFTPKLASTYATLKKKDENIELVFVSHDKNVAQFESYFKEMSQDGGTWLSVPYSGTETLRAQLASLCGVSGIPTLSVIAPDGSLIASDARQAAAGDPAGENFPWAGAAAPKGMPSWVLLALFFLFMVLPRLIEYFRR